jgi:hypothetical protein
MISVSLSILLDINEKAFAGVALTTVSPLNIWFFSEQSQQMSILEGQ